MFPLIGSGSRYVSCVTDPISTQSWSYADAFVAEDDILTRARERAQEVGVVAIGPGGGAALRFLASVMEARAVVEIGTGTGVSGLWLLRGMRSDGILTTVDIETEHQRLARETFNEAGIATQRARTIAGAALDVLPRLTDGHYDLAFVDGHGIAHPRRLGIAAHFGVASGVPTIGVAREVLVGTMAALHQTRGAYTPLRDGREQIGWVLRSKPGCNPLFVSPGHRVAMASAAELVMRFVTTYRLPEPTRLADPIASRHDRQRATAP